MLVYYIEYYNYISPEAPRREVGRLRRQALEVGAQGVVPIMLPVMIVIIAMVAMIILSIAIVILTVIC